MVVKQRIRLLPENVHTYYQIYQWLQEMLSAIIFDIQRMYQYTKADSDPTHK
jgi:hypothetical protein